MILPIYTTLTAATFLGLIAWMIGDCNKHGGRYRTVAVLTAPALLVAATWPLWATACCVRYMFDNRGNY
jgi:hypothetical protein